MVLKKSRERLPVPGKRHGYTGGMDSFVATGKGGFELMTLRDIALFALGAVICAILLLPLVDRRAQPEIQSTPVPLEIMLEFDRQLTGLENCINYEYYEKQAYIDWYEKQVNTTAKD